MLFILNTCTVIKRSYFLSLQDLETRLKKLINAADVMLFMKGTPTEPRCGKLGSKSGQIVVTGFTKNILTESQKQTV